MYDPKNPQDVEEMVALLDALMGAGSGHVNVEATEEADAVKVSTVKTNDCQGGACMQPTELLDDDAAQGNTPKKED